MIPLSLPCTYCTSGFCLLQSLFTRVVYLMTLKSVAILFFFAKSYKFVYQKTLKLIINDLIPHQIVLNIINDNGFTPNHFVMQLSDKNQRDFASPSLIAHKQHSTIVQTNMSQIWPLNPFYMTRRLNT